MDKKEEQDLKELEKKYGKLTHNCFTGEYKDRNGVVRKVVEVERCQECNISLTEDDIMYGNKCETCSGGYCNY